MYLHWPLLLCISNGLYSQLCICPLLYVWIGHRISTTVSATVFPLLCICCIVTGLATVYLPLCICSYVFRSATLDHPLYPRRFSATMYLLHCIWIPYCISAAVYLDRLHCISHCIPCRVSATIYLPTTVYRDRPPCICYCVYWPKLQRFEGTYHNVEAVIPGGGETRIYVLKYLESAQEKRREKE